MWLCSFFLCHFVRNNPVEFNDTYCYIGTMLKNVTKLTCFAAEYSPSPFKNVLSSEEDVICSYFLLCIVAFWHVQYVAGKTLIFWNSMHWQGLLGNAHLLMTRVCPLRKNCHDHKSVSQGALTGEGDDGWQEMWGIVTENTCGVNFPGYCFLALDMSQFSFYQQSTDYSYTWKYGTCLETDQEMYLLST